MKLILQFIITEKEAGLRLDQALSQLCSDYSRAQWQDWIKEGAICIDGELIPKTRHKVQSGQIIDVNATTIDQGEWQAQEIPLDIVYEDEDLLVINKPVGLVVHPGAGNPDLTLVNALLHYDPALKHIPRAGVVHRLDKDTSGLLVIARTLSSHNYLSKAISERALVREYQAIIHGELISGGTVDAPIDRHSTQRVKMAVKSGGRDAVTHYRLLKKFPNFTHIKCELETGRTHQIRVHMAHIGHPIVGDSLYGYARLNVPGKMTQALRDYIQHFPRQALHAWRLGMIHPSTQAEMQWEVPLPKDMQELLKYITQESSI